MLHQFLLGIFFLLGITIGDFMIAGGIILFVITMSDLLGGGEKKRRRMSVDLGVVPIGTPLIAGPVVLTTSLILVEQHGLILTVCALFSNIVLAGATFVMRSVLIGCWEGTGPALCPKPWRCCWPPSRS